MDGGQIVFLGFKQAFDDIVDKTVVKDHLAVVVNSPSRLQLSHSKGFIHL